MAPPNLPDEILVKIIKESIKPYDLRAKNKDPPGEGLVLDGIPKLMNILLVNKMFCEEALSAVKEKFSGNLVVDLDCVLSLMATNAFGKLKHGVRKVSVRRYDRDLYRPFMNLNLHMLLAPDYTPNLHRIILTVGSPDPVYWRSGLQDIIDNLSCYTAIADEVRRHLDKDVELLHTIQTRKLHVTMNSFLVEAHKKATEMVTMVVHGHPDEHGRHSFAVGKAWLSKFAEFERIVQKCETD